MSEHSDKEILEIFKTEGSESFAFNILVGKYQSRLYWHIRRLVIDHDDADDVLQNTFIKIWRNLKGFKEESELFTWLYRIATNESLSFLRKKKTKFFLPLTDVGKELSKNLEADAYFNADDIQLRLQKAILTLPEKQRVVFNLKYYEELKYEDMSDILKTSVGALKASYHHAVKKIELFLKEN